MTDRRFPPPWTMERLPGGFKVIDATGGKLGSPELPFFVVRSVLASIIRDGVTHPRGYSVNLSQTARPTHDPSH
jgi:hypothetical protein